MCPNPKVPQRRPAGYSKFYNDIRLLFGGRTRARTWDPMIKSHLQAALIQRVFRHVHVSSSIEITMEFSFVGIQGRRERVIGSNRTVGGSIRESAAAFPHTAQIRHISSDRPPKVSENCRRQGHGEFPAGRKEPVGRADQNLTVIPEYNDFSLQLLLFTPEVKQTRFAGSLSSCPNMFSQ
jgi:hypothetical protein